LENSLFFFYSSPPRGFPGHRKVALSTLRALAVEFGVVLLLLSQLDSQLEKRRDRRPMLCDLPRSGALEIVADTILLLYRDAYYQGREESEETSQVNIEVCIAKSKWDFSGACELTLRGKNLPMAAYWGTGH